MRNSEWFQILKNQCSDKMPFLSTKTYIPLHHRNLHGDKNGGSQKDRQMTETEKERWQIIGVIASAIGTAIAGYFAGKK